MRINNLAPDCCYKPSGSRCACRGDQPTFPVPFRIGSQQREGEKLTFSSDFLSLRPALQVFQETVDGHGENERGGGRARRRKNKVFRAHLFISFIGLALGKLNSHPIIPQV